MVTIMATLLTFDEYDIYYQLLENRIALKIRTEDIDGAIRDIENGFSKLNNAKVKNPSKHKRSLAMLYSNKGIALIYKLPQCTDLDELQSVKREAQELIENAMTIWVEIGDDFNIAVLKMKLADLAILDNDDFNQWMNSYIDAIHMLTSLQCDQAQITSADALLKVAVSLGRISINGDLRSITANVNVAIDYIKAVKSTYRQYCPLDKLRYLDAERNLYALKLYLPDFSSGHARTSKYISLNNGLKKVLNGYIELSQCDGNNGTITASLIGVYTCLGVCNFNLGIKFSRYEENKETLQYYRAALNYFKLGAETALNFYGEKYDDLVELNLNISLALIHIFECTKNSKNIKTAITILNQQIRITSEKSPKSILIAELFHRIGLCYSLIENYEKSIKYLNKANDIYRLYGDESTLAEIFYHLYRNYAQVFAGLKNKKLAISYIKQAKAILLSNGYSPRSEKFIELNKLRNKIKA